MRILCTNDDGYLAVGIGVLAGAAARFGDVTVVAPDREQSATSHSLTMHHPLRAKTTADGTHDEPSEADHGTPILGHEGGIA